MPSLDLVEEFPLCHAGISIILTGKNKDKVLLVVDREARIGFPGGRRKEDEDSDVCISREYKEELGNDHPENLEKIQKFVWTSRGGIQTAILLAYVPLLSIDFEGDGELVGFQIMKLGMLEHLANNVCEIKMRYTALGSTQAILHYLKTHDYKWEKIELQAPRKYVSKHEEHKTAQTKTYDHKGKKNYKSKSDDVRISDSSSSSSGKLSVEIRRTPSPAKSPTYTWRRAEEK